ncbi:MAG: DUF192 domain-containing protein [Deltaproteobacteria bacterium]|nr:DUF192 domain-containing protein [Deltaproteobacteria bacterium]
MGTNTKKRRAKYKHAVILLLFFVVVTVALLWYQRRLENRGLVQCHFENSQQEPLIFKVEIANNPAQRAKGLMFRKHLAPDRGMLFIYPRPQKLSFWMKDTYVSLDMIFMDSDFRVQGILENVPINNEKSRSVEGDNLYVLEVPAGSSARGGIKKGSVLQCKGTLPEGV